MILSSIGRIIFNFSLGIAQKLRDFPDFSHNRPPIDFRPCQKSKSWSEDETEVILNVLLVLLNACKYFEGQQSLPHVTGLTRTLHFFDFPRRLTQNVEFSHVRNSRMQLGSTLKAAKHLGWVLNIRGWFPVGEAVSLFCKAQISTKRPKINKKWSSFFHFLSTILTSDRTSWYRWKGLANA